MVKLNAKDYLQVVENLLLVHFGMDAVDVELENSVIEAAIERGERPFEMINAFVEKFDLERITRPSANISFVTTDQTISEVEESTVIRSLGLVSF